MTLGSTIEGKYFYVKFIFDGLGGQIINNDDLRFMMIFIEHLLRWQDRPGKIWLNDFNPRHQLEMVSFCLLSHQLDLLAYCYDDATIDKFTVKLTEQITEYLLDKYRLKISIDVSVKSIVSQDLLRTSKIIHKFPTDWQSYPYSSIRNYLYFDNCDWVKTNHITDTYPLPGDYLRFLQST